MAKKNTKSRAGVRGAKLVARNPRVRRATIRAARPAGKIIIKRQVRRRVQPVGSAARTVGDVAGVLVIHGPDVAREIGLVRPPKRRRALPTFTLLLAIAAAVAYLLRGARN